MRVPAREALTVFMNGDEVPGFMVYVLRDSKYTTKVDIPLDAWPDSRVRFFRLAGNAWEILRWDLAVAQWPPSDEWRAAVHSTLSELLSDNAVVAWIGAEGSPFSDPPYLFSPDRMAGSVLAAMTSTGDFFCPVDPDRPIRTLSDDELEFLRLRSGGLADAVS